jgi:hypothetical protein
VVAHVDHGRADTTAKALLCAIEDRVHHAQCLARSMHAVQALARVTQAVSDRLRERVLLGERLQHLTHAFPREPRFLAVLEALALLVIRDKHESR